MFCKKPNKVCLQSIFLFSFIVTILLMYSCAGTPEIDNGVKTNKDVLDALGENTHSIVFGSSDGPQLIITPELSARVLGASIEGDNGENLMWVDNTIYDGSYWTTKPYFWNAGGYRTWVAPEDLFFLDAENEWFVPLTLDPAPYKVIEQSELSATFEADVNLKTNIDKYYQTTIKRRILLLTDSPEKAGTLPDGISYMGIDLTHSLTNRSEEIIGVDTPYVCLWNLLQINPSGTTLVPLVDGYDPLNAYREYFEPLGDRITVQNNIISIKIDGAYRSKLGIHPAAAKSGIAFLRDNRDNTGVLFVMLMYIDPDGIYVDKPWGTESDYGDAIELYNDDGNMGGFAEIECHGPARQLKRGESQSHKATLHIYKGGIEYLKIIGSNLLDADLSKAFYY
ncbi:DUF6786 family protein [Candidatus Latescibacterota bacterium]